MSNIDLKNAVESSLNQFKYQIYSQEELLRKEKELEQSRIRERALAILEKANIPMRHRNNPPLFGTGWMDKHKAIETRIGTGFIIGLIGQRGTGKTQLAVQIAKATAKQGNSVRYTTAMGFFIDIKETFDDGKKSERNVIEEHSRPSFLIIDEVQERGQTPWEDRLLTHLIDKRYSSQRDTLIISNQNKDSFLASLGESVASRITETGGIMNCDWESYRTKTQ